MNQTLIYFRKAVGETKIWHMK